MIGRMAKQIGDAASRNWKKTAFLIFVSTIVGYCTIPIPVPLFLPDWVTDTRIPTGDFAWLDNRRIIIWRNEERRIPDLIGGKAEYVLWTDGPDGGTATPVDDLDALVGPDFCDGEGYDWNTQEKDLETEAKPKEGFVFNDFVCAETPIPESAKGRKVFPLRPGHGVISMPFGECRADCDSVKWSKPYRWHADDGSGRVVTLPNKNDDLKLSIEYFKYAPFLDAYLATQESYVKGRRCKFAWWIRPGPRFERFCAAPWGGWLGFVPTKLGPATHYRGIKTLIPEPFDRAYVYLTVNNRFVKPLPSHGYALKVSPDGCRLGRVHTRWATYDRDERGYSLYIIDLCGHEAEIRELRGEALDGK